LISPAQAAKKKAAEPIVLNEAGEALLQEYSAKLDALKAGIIEALPKMNEAKLAAYLKARERLQHPRIQTDAPISTGLNFLITK